MTGCTEKSCGVGNGPINFWDSTSIAHMLRRYGRSVQLRPFAVGEALDDVGAVLVIIGASATADHACHALGATWAMLEAMERDLPLVVLFEDWNLEAIGDGFHDLAERAAELIPSQVDGRPRYVGAEAALPHAGRIQDFARQFGDPLGPLWQVAVPAFLKFRAWGDRQTPPAAIRRPHRCWPKSTRRLCSCRRWALSNRCSIRSGGGRWRP